MSAQMFCQIFNWDFCLSYQVVSVLYTLSICHYQMLLFSHSVMTHSLGPHRLQQARLPCPSLSPGVCSNSHPLSWLWPLWLALELSLCLWLCHLVCWYATRAYACERAHFSCANSVRPYVLEPARLLCPWDPPGKSTGVPSSRGSFRLWIGPTTSLTSPTLAGRFLPLKWKWKLLSCVQLFVTPYSPRNSPGQNTGVGSLYLLQRIFLTQGSNPGLLHCRRILYHLSHKGSPRLPQWVAIPFSSGISQPRNWTGVFYIAGGFFTNWTITTSTTWNVYQIYHLKYLLSSCS